MYLDLYFKYCCGWLLVVVLKILLKNILPITDPFKLSGVKWLDFKVSRAILVKPTILNFLTFGRSGA